MNKYYLSGLLLIGAAMVSCSDNDEPEGPEGPQPNIQTITFEECEFAKDKTNNLVGRGDHLYRTRRVIREQGILHHGCRGHCL